MSKAFDKVDHTKLFGRLHQYGITGKLHDWFRSYLQGRRQQVTVLGATSRELPVTSGVPQGSLLGPILFLLFVDDLPNAVKTSRVACYADETKIFKSIDSITDCNALQSDLNDLVSWSESSGLIFNQSKCKYQCITRKKSPVQPTYTLKETPLESCDTEKDLGVWVSSNLTSDKQVTEQCAKANKLLGCRKRVNPRGNSLSQHEICRPVVNQHDPEYVGFAVRNTCPKNWTDEIVRHKCQNEDQSDLFNDWPVFDRHRRLTYTNVFCARCNGAVNTTYWKLEADCSEWFDTTAFNLSELMRFAHAKCSVKIRESWVQYLKQCIPRFQDCSGIAICREKNGSYCQSQCLGYAFPVCFIINKIIRFRNLQCALCNGFKPSYLKIDCFYQTGPLPPPPLTILFDFTSSFETRVTVIDEKMDLERKISHVWYYAANEVYDPYVEKCQSTVSLHPPQPDGPISQSKKTRKLLNLNCTFVAFKQSDYEQRPNGTVYIKPHHKIYGKTRYTIRRNILLLCVNFSRNATVFSEQPSAGYLTKTTPISLQIMTFSGCITSLASLLLLLATYTLFSELRNLPGRIIINLSLSLLLYQGVFLAGMKTSSHEQCQVIAILLHYFVLCSFTWMNAKAYDVHKTFTSSGEGEVYCFISKPEAVLYFFVAPVALIMLFNAFALVHTVLHIVKTRKRTQKVTNQRHSTGVAWICVKMASVMGVTWILGIAANVQALSFLWYPYVVLNSLQGLFIFLSFGASGRSLELYRGKIAMLRNRCSSTAANNTARTKDKIVVTRSGKTRSPDVQDCEEISL
ncbi:uncharacterized protein [Montipora capricornis]|uniref:uncharacterized protein n=1 Tax=Montipora capricornis TaxID=246305 RepID=UPI0035F125F4